MWSWLSRWLIGRPLATAQAGKERLTKTVALAVLSSDALSSVAYATEEILLVLAVAAAATQGGSFHYLLPISLAIAVLLWVVVLSYRQTIEAYPSGGGAYIVARENLGTAAGLTAAAALLLDYTLTVAVSVAAGVAAVTSAAQGTSFAWLSRHPVGLCLAAIALLTLVNLRGLRESGAIFAVPVYLFVFSFLGMIAWGLVRYYFVGGAESVLAQGTPKYAEGYGPQGVGLLLLLAAFSGGCTAMTGVEAISNGVPAFHKPESRNAAHTLLWMAGLLTFLFLGTSTLAYLYGVQPREEETVISQFARALFTGQMAWAYYLVQGTTALILVLAANTSFADFPRLSGLLARDHYLPAQFADRGDRLVYSNGIVALALLAALLVWTFKGDVSRLIPLYAIGVFLSFTLSQSGMVRHWWRLGHGQGNPAASIQETAPPVHRWRSSLAVNAVGALVTAVVLVVFVLTKFVHGAWIVVIVLPTLSLLLYAMGRHYRHVNEQLAPGNEGPVGGCPPNTAILPVALVHRGIRQALAYAHCLTRELRAVHVEVEPAETEQVQKDWAALGTNVPLEIVPSPYRAYVSVLLDYIERAKEERADGVVTVLLAEFVTPSWWQQVLHNGTVYRLKTALLHRPGIVVISVPFVLH